METTDPSNLVKKAEYSIKIAEIETKILDHDHKNECITTQEFNKFTAENFAARIKQADLETKADIANFIREADFDDKPKNLNKKATSN